MIWGIIVSITVIVQVLATAILIDLWLGNPWAGSAIVCTIMTIFVVQKFFAS